MKHLLILLLVVLPKYARAAAVTLSGGITIAGGVSIMSIETEAEAANPYATQIANVEYLSRSPVSFPVQFSNNWQNAAGYEPVRLIRSWTHTYVQGAAHSTTADPAAQTVIYVPWGYRSDGGLPPEGVLSYYNGTNYVQGAWVQADTRLNTSEAQISSAAGNRLDLRASWSATNMFLPVRQNMDTNICLMIPPNCTNPTTLVCFLHGMSGNQFDWLRLREESAYDAALIVVAKACFTNGWVLLNHYGRGNNFGNAGSLADYSNAVLWVNGSLTITNTVLLAGSMGGLAGTTLFATMPSISKLYGLSPVLSLSNAYYNASEGVLFSNAINTAHSTTAATFTDDTASFDPLRLATNAFGVRPIRISASVEDTTVHTNLHAYAFTNRFNSSNVTLTNSTGGHSAAGQVLGADIINFFR